MHIRIKEKFNKDYISREAGEKLRKKILSAIENKESIILDFEDLVVASTTFFDESIAKMIEENIEPDKFSEYVSIIGLNKNDRRILDKVTDYRGFNLNKETLS